MSSSPIPAPSPDASATARGLVNTSAQTFAGLKSFANGLSACGGKFAVDANGNVTVANGGTGAFVFQGVTGTAAQIVLEANVPANGLAMRVTKQNVGTTMTINAEGVISGVGGTPTLTLDGSVGARIAYGLTNVVCNGGQAQLFANSGTFTMSTNGWATCSGQVRMSSLGVGNSAAASTPGSVVKKVQVFDANGNSLGYVPIYDAIT